ncbi:MAG: rRNA maturation RNase YbeY [bacterium]
MEKDFSIINKTKGKLPSLSFVDAKNKILGEEYSLSIAFVDEEKSQELNKKYRNKNKPTNILSFSLRKDEGEIVLCPNVIKREAKSFEKTFSQFLKLLIVHGMLHLKGIDHGDKMENAEKKYLSEIKF